MVNEILCSIGALVGRPNGCDWTLLRSFTRQLKFKGYEFMMSSKWYDHVDEIVKFLKDEGIKTPVYHCQKSIGEAISKGDPDSLKDAFDRYEINVKMARDIGASKLVMHLWDGITSDAYFDNNIRAYPILKEIADSYKVDLLVENVVCNVKNPLERWCELVKNYPDIGFIFDTKMAAFHGQLELLYTTEYEWLWKDGHIRHYHVNDYGGGIMDWENLRTLPIGKGHLDFDRFFRFIERIGYTDSFTLESTAFNKEGKVDLEMLNRQWDMLMKR